MVGSPSELSLQKIEQPGVPQNKNRIRLAVNYGGNGSGRDHNAPGLQSSASNNVLPHNNGGGYKRIVNIYSLNENGAPRHSNGTGLNSYKKQRRSQAPEQQRLYLNHSLVPPGGMPLSSNSKQNYGVNDRRSPSMENLQLPELKNVHRH